MPILQVRDGLLVEEAAEPVQHPSSARKKETEPDSVENARQHNLAISGMNSSAAYAQSASFAAPPSTERPAVCVQPPLCDGKVNCPNCGQLVWGQAAQ